jgi:hypothetical protein
MAPDRFKMVRIAVPTWAPPYARGATKFGTIADKYYDAITPTEQATLAKMHGDILTMVAALVEEYANDGCAPPGEEWFPQRLRLTGEFYIGGESYHRLPGEPWIQVCVEARCIGREPGGPRDYLGLHVWLRYDPQSNRLWNHRNTDSMVI